MKRLIKLLAAAGPLLAASLAFGGISGSKHDFSAQTWSDNQICKPCHTPHNGDVSLTGRIWAHTLSKATYKYHGGNLGTAGSAKWVDGSTSQDGGTGSLTQDNMDAGTRLCLSCHDGTVALDSFMGKNGGATGKSIGDFAAFPDANGKNQYNPNLGGGAVGDASADLSNDHPVGYSAILDETVQHGSYSYKPLADVKGAGLKLAVTTTALAGGYVYRTGDINPATGVAYPAPTYTNKVSVSCVTCHDVHNAGASGEAGLLRISNTGSALCLTCHNK